MLLGRKQGGKGRRYTHCVEYKWASAQPLARISTQQAHIFMSDSRGLVRDCSIVCAACVQAQMNKIAGIPLM